MVRAGEKYHILEYPGLGLADVHIVKVRKVFENPLLGTIVDFSYNWPFTIDKQVTLKEFKSWIATEVKNAR